MTPTRQEKRDAKAELALFEKRREFLKDEIKRLRAVKSYAELNKEDIEWSQHIQQELPENRARIKELRDRLGIQELSEEDYNRYLMSIVFIGSFLFAIGIMAFLLPLLFN